jgi:hypothetical protein
MAQKLQVYGWGSQQFYDLWVGEEVDFTVWGPIAENGVVAWVSVKPFPDGRDYPGEKVITVTSLSHEASDDGGRRIFVSVKNTGPSDILAYVFYWAWTDAVTQ